MRLAAPQVKCSWALQGEPTGEGAPWVRAPSGGRAAPERGEEVSGSPCRAAPALHGQCWLKLSVRLECAHRSAPRGVLAHATELVEPRSLHSSVGVRGHRWEEDSIWPGVDSIQVQAGFSVASRTWGSLSAPVLPGFPSALASPKPLLVDVLSAPPAHCLFSSSVLGVCLGFSLPFCSRPSFVLPCLFLCVSRQPLLPFTPCCGLSANARSPRSPPIHSLALFLFRGLVPVPGALQRPNGTARRHLGGTAQGPLPVTSTFLSPRSGLCLPAAAEVLERAPERGATMPCICSGAPGALDPPLPLLRALGPEALR